MSFHDEIKKIQAECYKHSAHCQDCPYQHKEYQYCTWSIVFNSRPYMWGDYAIPKEFTK